MGLEVNTLFDNRKKRKIEPLNPGRVWRSGDKVSKAFQVSTSFQFHPLLAQQVAMDSTAHIYR